MGDTRGVIPVAQVCNTEHIVSKQQGNGNEPHNGLEASQYHTNVTIPRRSKSRTKKTRAGSKGKKPSFPKPANQQNTLRGPHKLLQSLAKIPISPDYDTLNWCGIFDAVLQVLSSACTISLTIAGFVYILHSDARSQWTALKDLMEFCEAGSMVALQSPTCPEILQLGIRDPPYTSTKYTLSVTTAPEIHRRTNYENGKANLHDTGATAMWSLLTIIGGTMVALSRCMRHPLFQSSLAIERFERLLRIFKGIRSSGFQYTILLQDLCFIPIQLARQWLEVEDISDSLGSSSDDTTIAISSSFQQYSSGAYIRRRNRRSQATDEVGLDFKFGYSPFAVTLVVQDLPSIYAVDNHKRLADTFERSIPRVLNGGDLDLHENCSKAPTNFQSTLLFETPGLPMVFRQITKRSWPLSNWPVKMSEVISWVECDHLKYQPVLSIFKTGKGVRSQLILRGRESERIINNLGRRRRRIGQFQIRPIALQTKRPALEIMHRTLVCVQQPPKDRPVLSTSNLGPTDISQAYIRPFQQAQETQSFCFGSQCERCELQTDISHPIIMFQAAMLLNFAYLLCEREAVKLYHYSRLQQYGRQVYTAYLVSSSSMRVFKLSFNWTSFEPNIPDLANRLAYQYQESFRGLQQNKHAMELPVCACAIVAGM